MEGDRPQEIEPPQDFDITEVAPTSDEVMEVVNAGTIEIWRMIEFAEKMKARPYITGIVLSAWATIIIASVWGFLITGNFLLFTPPALISAPLCIVLNFYFRSG